MLTLDYAPSKFQRKCNWVVFSLFIILILGPASYYLFPHEVFIGSLLFLIIALSIGFFSERISNSVYVLVRGALVIVSLFIRRVTLFVANYLFLNGMKYFFEKSQPASGVKAESATSWQSYVNMKDSDLNHDDGYSGLIERIFKKKQFWLMPVLFFMFILRLYKHGKKYSEVPTDTYTLY